MPPLLNASRLFGAATALSALAGCPAPSTEAEEPSREPRSSTSAKPLEKAAPVAPPPALLHLEVESAPKAAASTPRPAPEKRACRVAALGDSLTDYRSGGGGYLRVLEKRCPQSEFVNYGKGGDMVNQMRRRFEREILPLPAQSFTHLIVFGGVNDLYSDETAGRTPEKVQVDLSAIYGAARTRGWRVVALSVAPWGGFKRWFTDKRSASTRALNDWIRASESRSETQRVVDAYRLLSCGDAERLCPEFEPPFKDGLHFGKAGHEVLGNALYDAEFASCR